MNVFCYVQRIRIGQNIRLIKLHFCGVHFFLLLCFAFCFALSCLWAIWLSRLLAQISLAIFFSSKFFFQKRKNSGMRLLPCICWMNRTNEREPVAKNYANNVLCLCECAKGSRLVLKNEEKKRTLVEYIQSDLKCCTRSLSCLKKNSIPLCFPRLLSCLAWDIYLKLCSLRHFYVFNWKKERERENNRIEKGKK